MQIKPAVIIGYWETKDVFINGLRVTPAGFVRDLKAAEREPGDNGDILQECRWVRRFSWGDTSRATACLALACCFYLKLSWVMVRFFTKELERVPRGDLRLSYNDAALEAAYEQCEDLFGVSADHVHGCERFNLQNTSRPGGTMRCGSADHVGRLEAQGWEEW
jgi:hypothetical protein